MKIEDFPYYVDRYISRVIGFPVKLQNSDQPAMSYPEKERPSHKNVTIYLPLSPSSIRTFFGWMPTTAGVKPTAESVGQMEKLLDENIETAFGAIIGLAYHECAHALSGEYAFPATPKRLHNLVCDGNDFSYVPKAWPGASPFTHLLMRAHWMSFPDLSAPPAATTGDGKTEKLQLLFNLCLSYLRYRKFKWGAATSHSLPAGHDLYDYFERARPIIGEARFKGVEVRPSITQRLFDIMKEFWIKETEKQAGHSLNGNEMAEAVKEIEDKLGMGDQGQANLSGDIITIRLNKGDLEKLAKMSGADLKTVRGIIKGIAVSIANSEGKPGKTEDVNTETWEKSQIVSSEARGEVVRIDSEYVGSIRRILEKVVAARRQIRLAPSVEGLALAPERFHELKSNRKAAKVFKERLRFKQRRDEAEIILCFDRSGSMGGEKWKICNTIAQSLYRALYSLSGIKVHVFGFDDNVHQAIIPRRHLSLDRSLSLIGGALVPSGNTNFPGAMKVCVDILKTSRANQRVCFLLTDGDTGTEAYLRLIIKEANKVKVNYWVLGIPSADPVRLKTVFGKKGLFVKDPKQLPEILKRLITKKI